VANKDLPLPKGPPTRREVAGALGSPSHVVKPPSFAECQQQKEAGVPSPL